MARRNLAQPVPEGLSLVAPGEKASEPSAEDRNQAPPRPHRIRVFMKRRLADEMPAIATALIDKIKQGGLAELKVALQLAGLDGKEPPSDPAERKFGGRYFEDILKEEWRKEDRHDPEALRRAEAEGLIL